MKETKNASASLPEVIHRAELVNLHVKSVKSDLHLAPIMLDTARVAVEIDRNIQWQRAEKEDGIVCFITLKITGKATKEHPHVEANSSLFEIKVEVAAIYKLNTEDCSNEVLTSFANLNGLYNTYPYAREMISNLMSRMGLPALTLPLLKPAPGITQEPNENRSIETNKK